MDTIGYIEPVGLRPLGDRVLVRPIANPTMSDGGLHLVEHRKPEEQGVVVAVGRTVHPLKDVASSLAMKLRGYDQVMAMADADEHLHRDAAALLEDLTRREPVVQPGDTVLFSWQSGQEVTIDDDRLF